MNVLYLKAASEAALKTALSFARFTDIEGQESWLLATAEYSLDVIGDIYNEDAVYDNRTLVKAATKKVGFHANIICNERILALIPQSIIIIPPPGRIIREWA